MTFEGRGRVTMDELRVFEVDDGRIVTEQFFYSLDGPITTTQESA